MPEPRVRLPVKKGKVVLGMSRKCCNHCPRKKADLAVQPVTSCIERFATAKKFHAENLQHQPLPDRVDDAIFSTNIDAADPSMREAVKRCQKIVPRRQSARKKDRSRGPRYGPALGCKKPTTYMDLAICWETPEDPIYDPPRPSHIDGSDGGPAPAVFTLVQHQASQVDVRDGSIPSQREDCDEEPRSGRSSCCRHCEQCIKEQGGADDKEELCRDLDSMHISGANSKGSKAKRTHFQRHCVGCAQREKADTLVRTRSAICSQRKPAKNNALPARVQVPRPRTPYARRSFCIDSLTPPFSVVAGYRDTDYPEHWRLTSVYRQSYRNPKKMREGRSLLKYDRT